MTPQETYIDKLLQKDNVATVKRLLIGGLLSTAAFLGGIGWVVGVGVTSIGINSGVIRYEKRIQEKKLLNFYRDEIAALQHKPAEALTLEDLREVARPVSEGGKGVATLQHELQGQSTYAKFRMGGSSLSSAITTSLLVTLCLTVTGFLSGGLTTILGLGLIGFGHTLVAKTVKTTSQAMFGVHEMDNSVHQKLMRIGEEIKEKPVSPIEIFGLCVESDPLLKSKIQYSFKADYADLPVLQKKQVVEKFEPELRIIALTEAINAGAIKPSFAGLIAGGFRNDALPGYGQYRALFTCPAATVSDKPFEVASNDINLAEHRKRVLEQREAAAANKSLH